jgi:hypothetical protein
VKLEPENWALGTGGGFTDGRILVIVENDVGGRVAKAILDGLAALEREWDARERVSGDWSTYLSITRIEGGPFTFSPKRLLWHASVAAGDLPAFRPRIRVVEDNPMSELVAAILNALRPDL